MINSLLRVITYALFPFALCACGVIPGSFPSEFPAVSVPSDNPGTEAGIALGKKLFFDPILSSNGEVSCASCHQQASSFGDSVAISPGVDGALGNRNANPLINLAWSDFLFWDGRAASLEEQSLGPIENPLEMNETLENVVLKVQSQEEYPVLFELAFGSSEVTSENIGKAIAQYERTLVSASSPYDEFIVGNRELSTNERRGMDLFFSSRTNCSACHDTILFTDGRFHDIGLDANPSDLGRGAITSEAGDDGKFKTPTLRNISLTGPYMHDGRFTSLRQVLDFYDRNIQNSPNLSGRLNNLRRNGLSGRDKEDIISFLLLLTDQEFVNNEGLGE